MTAGLRTSPQRSDGAVHRPASLTDALVLLRSHQPLATVCMGGTDLVPRLRQRPDPAAHIVCCSRLGELQRITVGTDAVEIGAGATYRSLAGHAELRSALPALAELAGTIANPRVRNRGTLGGVICAGRARSDPPTLLSALDAVVVLSSMRGQRTLPIEHVIQGHRATAVAGDEMLTSIRIPRPSEQTNIGFDRVGSSQGPIVNVALSRERAAVRLAIGGVRPAPHVVTVPEPGAGAIAEVAREAIQQVWSGETSLASRWYCAELGSRVTTRLIARLEASA